jgi:transcriptional regulator with AAA-type ATPase domain/TolB-like protein/Tfp pilus assembly protein PilF
MDPVDDLIGQSARMVALREQVRGLLERERAMRRLPPVLIVGETGTGKGLLASVIHRASSRAGGQFVEASCAALPDTLIESELFGYERGAFTDARQSKPGLMQIASDGTLFLDELGLLSPLGQGKLLHGLEDPRVRRLGGIRTETVNVSIISATNEDLTTAVHERRFREDLYHRLAVIVLALPPLRDRGGDIDLLAARALAQVCAEYALPAKRLSTGARDMLRAHHWPGNVRELNNVLRRVALLFGEPVITAEMLALDEASEAHVESAESDRERLSETLARTGWNISRTAALLGITRNTVRARIARYGLRDGVDEPAPAAADLREEPGGVIAVAGPAPVVAVPSGSVAVSPPTSWNAPGLAILAVGATRPPEPESGRPSIAALPLCMEGEAASQSYFGDGVVEDIIGALATLRDLFVISRSSTLRYRDANVDVRVVGRDLGVAYVLSGSVRRAGPRLRIAVELAETQRGTVLWGQRFDGAAEDLFALQDEIAGRVVNTIAPHVREVELRRSLRRRPESLQVYDCMLRAQAQLYRLDRDEFAEAQDWLQKAIALDPSSAAPYALLAIWHALRDQQGWSPDPAADQAEVARLAAAALERDGFDAVALALSGHARSILRHEFDEALSLFARAIAAGPSCAVAWIRSSPTYSYLGDVKEAIRRAEYGLRLSPLDPHVFYTHGVLGLAHYLAGEYDKAVQWGRKALEANPRHTANLRILAASLVAAGHLEEAHTVAGFLLALVPGFSAKSFVEGYALQDRERRTLLLSHLRRAGLPE